MRLKATIINLIIVIVVLAFVGVEPLSTYKNNILGNSQQTQFVPLPIPPPRPEPKILPMPPIKPATIIEPLQNSSVSLNIHKLVNSERQERGLQPVKWSDMLAKNAQSQAEHCAEKGYMIHSSRYAFQGGENLVFTTGHLSAETAVEVWMASIKGHREYLLSPRVRYAGVGVASKNGKTFAAWAFADMAIFTEYAD